MFEYAQRSPGSKSGPFASARASSSSSSHGSDGVACTACPYAGSRLPAYGQAVQATPSEPWDDEELLARALANGPDFEPGDRWAYSNTGFLLVRRIVDAVVAGGFAGAPRA